MAARTTARSSESLPDAINPFALAGEVADCVEIRDVHLVECSCMRDKASSTADAPGVVILLKHPDGRISPSGHELIVDLGFALEATSGDEPKTPLSVGAVFRLTYDLKARTKLSDQHVKAFSEINGVFNAWPYWRHFVQDMTARMGIGSPIVVPVFQFSRVLAEAESNPPVEKPGESGLPGPKTSKRPRKSRRRGAKTPWTH